MAGRGYNPDRIRLAATIARDAAATLGTTEPDPDRRRFYESVRDRHASAEACDEPEAVLLVAGPHAETATGRMSLVGMLLADASSDDLGRTARLLLRAVDWEETRLRQAVRAPGQASPGEVIAPEPPPAVRSTPKRPSGLRRPPYRPGRPTRRFVEETVPAPRQAMPASPPDAVESLPVPGCGACGTALPHHAEVCLRCGQLTSLGASRAGRHRTRIPLRFREAPRPAARWSFPIRSMLSATLILVALTAFVAIRASRDPAGSTSNGPRGGLEVGRATVAPARG